jgi:hypothetical protein
VVASLYAPPSAYEDAVANEKAQVQVQNGTYRRQLAMIGGDQIQWRGLDVVETGPADNPNYKQTQIIVYHDKPRSLETLVQLLAVRPENVIQQPDANPDVDFLVILGEDYDPCR